MRRCLSIPPREHRLSSPLSKLRHRAGSPGTEAHPRILGDRGFRGADSGAALAEKISSPKGYTGHYIEVVGIHALLKRWPYEDGILRRLPPRVPSMKPISAPLRF